MHEDGIGMARTFELEFHGRVDRRDRCARSGFFAAVDRPAQPRRLHRPAYDARGCTTTAGEGGRRVPGHARPPRRRAPIGVLTGELGARVIGPLVDVARPRRRAGDPGRNEFFGGNTGVTGLMTGADVAPRARQRAGTAPLPAARRLPVRRRPVPRRAHRRRPAAPGRGRATDGIALACARSTTGARR